jgi:hypothetical protein
MLGLAANTAGLSVSRLPTSKACRSAPIDLRFRASGSTPCAKKNKKLAPNTKHTTRIARYRSFARNGSLARHLEVSTAPSLDPSTPTEPPPSYRRGFCFAHTTSVSTLRSPAPPLKKFGPISRPGAPGIPQSFASAGPYLAAATSGRLVSLGGLSWRDGANFTRTAVE